MLHTGRDGSGAQRWRGELVASVGVGGLVAAAVVVALSGEIHRYFVSVFLCSALWGLAAFAFVQFRHRAVARATWPLEAHVLFLMAFLAIFCVRPVAVMLSAGRISATVGMGYTVELDDRNMALALLVAAVALIGYLLGFALPGRPGRSVATARARRVEPSASVFWGAVLIGAGVVAGLVFLAQVGIRVSAMLDSRGGWEGDASVLQRSSGYLFVARLLCIPGLALFVMGALRRNSRSWRIGALLGTLGVGLWMALFGSRLVLFFIAFVYLVARCHVQRRQLSRAVILGLLVFGYAGYLLAEVVRVNARYYADNPEKAYDLAAERMRSVRGGDLLTFDRFVLLVRFFREEKPLLYGETLYEAAVLPVPRSLWPEKPLYGISKHFYPSEAKSFFGANFSVVGELFANFGLLGTAIGMFLFGVGMRRVDRLRSDGEADDLLFLLAISVSILVPYAVDAAPWGIVSNAAVFMVPTVVLGRMVCRPA